MNNAAIEFQSFPTVIFSFLLLLRSIFGNGSLENIDIVIGSLMLMHAPIFH